MERFGTLRDWIARTAKSAVWKLEPRNSEWVGRANPESYAERNRRRRGAKLTDALAPFRSRYRVDRGND
jgi:hypothetical protein